MENEKEQKRLKVTGGVLNLNQNKRIPLNEGVLNLNQNKKPQKDDSQKTNDNTKTKDNNIPPQNEKK